MKKIVKRGLSSEKKRIQHIIDEENYASDEEILRVYTKIKKAYDKGLGEKIHDKDYLKGVITQINNTIKYDWMRKNYSVGRLKTIEEELNMEIAQYNIVVD